jgi:heptosyltransferase III
LKRIIISRTDSIGDVILTLPIAGVLKEIYPACKIIFLGTTYSEPVINSSEFVDEFIDWQKIKNLKIIQQVKIFKETKADVILHVFPRIEIARVASKANIPLRVGTNRRLYNLLYCNKLVKLSRKKSALHESQLNLTLLSGIDAKAVYDLSEIPKYYGLTKIMNLDKKYIDLLKTGKVNLIIHPKSKGSAREWGLKNFSELIELLPSEKFRIFVTGTKDEGQLLNDFLLKHNDKIVDMTGKLTLYEFISFINLTDGLIAASTGPLHIAAALGKFALGLYAPMKPIFPQRWKPVGTDAHYMVIDKKKCNDCRKAKDCVCIRSIKPKDVYDKINSCLSKFSL